MTAEKAVEILHLSRVCAFEGNANDLEGAHQLGTEALQRLQEIRTYKTLMGLAISNPGRLLPSEDTK